jgi:riboflavin kinase/FMN adenylyltransferase
MNIYKLEEELTLPDSKNRRILCIGNFDGVHLGHQKLIKRALESKKDDETKLSILSFEPHPVNYFKKEVKNNRITTLAEKSEIASRLGVDELFIANFNEDFASLNAEEFIEKIIVDKISADIVFTGEDYRFGKDRKGCAKLLKESLDKFGFNYFPVSLENDENGEKLSSSYIRDLLKNGKIKEANDLLGHQFLVIDKVVKGKGEGSKTLNISTANIDFGEYKLIPKHGVYNCIADINGERYKAACNIGVRPSFDDGDKANLEAHILNYDGDLYGKELRIEFYDYIREEIRFDNFEELKEQINKDINIVKESSFV